MFVTIGQFRMNNMIERKYLITLCYIMKNEIAIINKSMYNFRINVYDIINESYGRYIAKFLDSIIIDLFSNIRTRGFEGKNGRNIPKEIITGV